MNDLKNVKAGIELITVAKAKLILTRNKSNRPINTDNVNFIAHAMKQNTFKFTGEPIIFGLNDDLMDGQHRLEALILTGKEQQFLTVRGVENDSFKYIDIGKTRSAADILSIQNIVNPHSYASIAKFILLFNKGGYEKAAGRQSYKRLKISNADISDFVIKRHVSLTESRTYGFVKECNFLSGNILSAFHYIFKQIDENDASEFCKKLADGKELEPKDAIFLLRQELKQDIINTRKMDTLEKIALICKAWNLYRKNRKVDNLKWDIIKDEFPKPM